jgi:hypothetical protein
MTENEVLAKALLCPESEKIPLKVEDRVIALESFLYFHCRIKRGERGDIVEINPNDSICPLWIKWDGQDNSWWGFNWNHIGKLVPKARKPK